MGSLVTKDEFLYGICINSCQGRNYETGKKDYDIFKGSMVKVFELNQDRLVISLNTDKCMLRTSHSSCFHLVDYQLFKYLNAINDLEDRLKFYTNTDQREFIVRHLEPNSVVIVDCDGQHIIACFRDVRERQDNSFITVELLRHPPDYLVKTLTDVSDWCSSDKLKYSLPANMIIKNDLWLCHVCLTENLKVTVTCHHCLNDKADTIMIHSAEPNMFRSFVATRLNYLHQKYDPKLNSCWELTELLQMNEASISKKLISELKEIFEKQSTSQNPTGSENPSARGLYYANEQNAKVAHEPPPMMVQETTTDSASSGLTVETDGPKSNGEIESSLTVKERCEEYEKKLILTTDKIYKNIDHI